MPTRLIPALMDYVRPPEPIPVRRGSPHMDTYPIILVDRLRDATRGGTESTLGTSEEELYVQITVASLDPVEGEPIAEWLRERLRSGPPLAWDAGRPGREVTRYETDAREREERSEAPGARTVYYHEIDYVFVIQRGGIAAPT